MVAPSCVDPEVTCNDDDVGNTSTVLFEAAAGSPWVVIVDTFAPGSEGPFVLNASSVDCPASSLTGVPVAWEGDTTGTVAGIPTYCGDSVDGASFSWTAPADGLFEVRSSAGFEHTLSIRESCVGFEALCDVSAAGLTTTLVDAVAGETFVITVAGAEGLAGPVSVSIDEKACLTGLTDLGSASGSSVAVGTNVGGAPVAAGTCFASSDAQVGFTWTAPSPGRWTFDTLGSAFDTTLVLLDACGASERVCNDDAMGGETSSVRTTLAAGDVVTVVVGGAGSATGDFVLSINPS
jgi:hypothetical protein